MGLALRARGAGFVPAQDLHLGVFWSGCAVLQLGGPVAALRGYGLVVLDARALAAVAALEVEHLDGVLHLVGEVLVELALPDECLARAAARFEIVNSHRCFEVSVERRGLVLRVIPDDTRFGVVNLDS